MKNSSSLLTSIVQTGVLFLQDSFLFAEYHAVMASSFQKPGKHPMKSTKQLMEEASHIQLPVLKSMEYLIDKSRDNGYESDFIIQDGAMLCNQSKRKFCPEEVHIVNFYRFEGISDPEDNSILYIIETTDGTKGTLADAYGVYSSPEVDEFIKLVTDIHKKVDK